MPKLNRSMITGDKALAVMWCMSRQIDRIEEHPRFPAGVWITNEQANVLQNELNSWPGQPVVSDCTYRGHPIIVEG